jgi:hypothetical protein
VRKFEVYLKEVATPWNVVNSQPKIMKNRRTALVRTLYTGVVSLIRKVADSHRPPGVRVLSKSSFVVSILTASSIFSTVKSLSSIPSAAWAPSGSTALI